MVKASKRYESRVKAIRQQIEESTSDYDKENFKKESQNSLVVLL